MRVAFSSIALLSLACSSQESDAPRSTKPADAGKDVSTAPYDLPVFDSVRIGSDSNGPNFQRAEADVDFGTGPFQSVTLVADLASSCFPFDTWTAPPPGQNWPADCDAFDRNYEFHLDFPSDASAGPPGLELERAITPFGGPLHLEVDVTDVANGLPGKHRLVVVIPTYSDPAGKVSGSAGGWNVSAHFAFVPGPAPRHVLLVKSLYDGNQTDPGPIQPIDFEVPPGTSDTRVEFRATGHGGVSGVSSCGFAPAEEFCLRTFAMYADGISYADAQPWRNDCDKLCTIAHQNSDAGGFDYCKENPCGAIQSVKAPRANWCPGSETPPFTWDLPGFGTPGPHSFAWQIDDEAVGGTWRLSATFFAFGS